MTDETQMLLRLLLGITVMVFPVMKTKTHTFIALLLAAPIIGTVGHTSPPKATDAIQNGFGSTLKNIGIITGLGVMMGDILEKIGAAERLAHTFTRLIGRGKEEWALGITGWLVFIPVFVDPAIVISALLCKAMSRITGKSVVGLALALACGLQCVHVMVPPTPDPLTAAGIMGIDAGQMTLAGSGMPILIFAAAILYAKWMGRNIYQIPHEDGTLERTEYRKEYLKTMDRLGEIMNVRELPGLAPSLAPIPIPLVLILPKTIADFVGMLEGTAYTIISLLGSPVVALGIRTTLAAYGLGAKTSEEKLLSIMSDSIRDVGMIMLIIGVGGSLGNIIKANGIGDVLGATVVSRSIPVILTPLIISVLMRLVLGSAIVVITTVASLTAPLVSVLGVNPILLVQSCCVGAIVFSYFNDSGFWVFNGMLGLTDSEDQLKRKMTIFMIITGAGIVGLLVFNMVMQRNQE